MYRIKKEISDATYVYTALEFDQQDEFWAFEQTSDNKFKKLRKFKKFIGNSRVTIIPFVLK
jgi:hypothetical protein